MARVQLKGLVKRYGKNAVVKGLDLDVASGEFVTLLGPSGCGKTTTLRCIAGLETPDGGDITVGDRVMNGPGIFIRPEHRDLGMIFQSYAVWPHMTVHENVAFGLRFRKLSTAAVETRVTEALELVGLSEYKWRFGTELSGGQQQRVAVARSIALQPKVLLFDEPLSNLDAKLRVRMRTELRQLVKSLGITSLYVTHDQEEAMAISDRVILMNHGLIIQQGPPREVYHRPQTAFVANFVGQTNFMAGVVAARDDGGLASPALGEGGMATISLAGVGTLRCAIPGETAIGSAVLVGVRPEHLRIVSAGNEAVWPAEVLWETFLGNASELGLRVGEHELVIHVRQDEPVPPVGSQVFITAAPERVLYFPEGPSALPELGGARPAALAG